MPRAGVRQLLLYIAMVTIRHTFARGTFLHRQSVVCFLELRAKFVTQRAR
jgi:hypothetical protein